MKGLTKYYLFVLSINFAYTQSTYFNNTYDINNGYNPATAVAAVKDGYVYIGQYIDAVKRQMFIAKVDLNGDTLWTNIYGIAPEIYYTGRCGSLIETSDGGFAMCGTYSDSSGGQVDLLFVRFDSMGDTLWKKKYGGNNYDEGNCCIELSDKSYVLFGRTDSYGNGQEDFYLLKIDSTGNQLWQKTYGGSKNENGLYVEQTYDKGFILSGWTNSFGAGDYDGYIVKTDSNGNFKWKKTFGSTLVDICYTSETSDSGFIVSGSMDFGAGYEDQAFLAKLSSSGDTVWQKMYGSQKMELLGSTAIELKDGSFVVSGTRRDSANHDIGWLLKVSSLGDSIWSRMFRTESSVQAHYFYDLEQTWDKGFVLIGSAFDSTQDAWLVKVDSMGCLVAGCDTMGNSIISLNFPPNQYSIKVSPNPFKYSTTLEVQYDFIKPNNQIELVIYDIFGRISKKMTTNTTQFTIHRDNMLSGIYFYQVKIEQNELSSSWKVINTGKLIVE